ncbi:MAG: ABC transporter permease [Actinobacteria bacterium HGW-Actinobacteria-6]|nr:MAG: ABC transporter permease [Actinobacteria bacterium HGW-Actinobacteria-6]
MNRDERSIDRVEDHPVKDYRSGMPSTPPFQPDEQHAGHENRTLWGDAWNRLRKNRLAVIALMWLVIVTAAAISADFWVPQVFGSPTVFSTSGAAELRLKPPTLAHPMGTDDVGRDLFARVIYGSRISLTVGVLAVVVSLVIGLILGSLSAFYGGILDAFIMRIADIFLAFPYILFAILLLSVLPDNLRGITPVFLTIGILGWPSIARVFRSSVLSVKENDYVEAGRALGASDIRLMLRHILPNAVAPIIVYGTMSVGGAILTEAALSFLGLGLPPGSPSWGGMIQDGRIYLTSSPGVVLWPGLAILSTVLAFTLLGDGIRDALDVKMKD